MTLAYMGLGRRVEDSGSRRVNEKSLFCVDKSLVVKEEAVGRINEGEVKTWRGKVRTRIDMKERLSWNRGLESFKGRWGKKGAGAGAGGE